MPDLTPAETVPHLWEIDHPYYGAEGYSNEAESWQEFADEIGKYLDPDLNHLYRWDWDKPGHTEYADREVLRLFFIMPRKSACMSYEIPVTDADEPAVRAWLQERTKDLDALWAPILLGGGS